MDGQPEIVVYTQPHCASCRQLERYLDDRGFSFVLRDVLAEPDALEELSSRGYMSTPVTRIDDKWIAGFRRKQLDRLLDLDHR